MSREKRRGSGSHRDQIERESDLLRMYEDRLKGYPPGEIYARLNEKRRERAYRFALEGGASEAEAAAAGEDAMISRQMLWIDFKTVEARLQVGVNASSQALAIQRIQELAVEVETLTMIASDVHREIDARKDRGGVDPALFARAESLVLSRVKVGGEMFQLAARLGARVPEDVQRLLQDGQQEAARAALLAFEIGRLYSADGSGEVTPERVRIIRELGAPNYGKPGDPPGAVREIRVVEVPLPDPVLDVKSEEVPDVREDAAREP